MGAAATTWSSVRPFATMPATRRRTVSSMSPVGTQVSGRCQRTVSRDNARALGPPAQERSWRPRSPRRRRPPLPTSINGYRPLKKRSPHMEDIGAGKVDDYVAVGMSLADVRHADMAPVPVEADTVVERHDRKGRPRCLVRAACQVPKLRRVHTPVDVLVSDNQSSCLPQVLVAAGVVAVPVGIQHPADGLVGHCRDRRQDLLGQGANWSSTRRPRLPPTDRPMFPPWPTNIKRSVSSPPPPLNRPRSPQTKSPVGPRAVQRQPPAREPLRFVPPVALRASAVLLSRLGSCLPNLPGTAVSSRWHQMDVPWPNTQDTGGMYDPPRRLLRGLRRDRLTPNEIRPYSVAKWESGLSEQVLRSLGKPGPLLGSRCFIQCRRPDPKIESTTRWKDGPCLA